MMALQSLHCSLVCSIVCKFDSTLAEGTYVSPFMVMCTTPALASGVYQLYVLNDVNDLTSTSNSVQFTFDGNTPP